MSYSRGVRNNKAEKTSNHQPEYGEVVGFQVDGLGVVMSKQNGWHGVYQTILLVLQERQKKNGTAMPSS